MKLPSRLEGALLLSGAVLAACGGGGGDAGTCGGSPEVCAEGQETAAPAPATPGTTQTTGVSAPPPAVAPAPMVGPLTNGGY